MPKNLSALVAAIEKITVTPTVYDSGAGASFDRGAAAMRAAVLELANAQLVPPEEPAPELVAETSVEEEEQPAPKRKKK